MLKAVEVENLAGLERAFKAADKEEAKKLRVTLKAAAEPVKATGQARALSQIRRMTVPWSRMRIGQSRAIVYMVPKEKGRRSKSNPKIRRPKLKDRLLDEAMYPALDEHRNEIVRSVDHMLNTVGAKWQATP